MKKLIIFIGFFLALAVVPTVSFAAILSLSPETGVYSAGTNFSVAVLLDTQGVSVNASEGTLSFSPSDLKVINVTNTGSIFNLWAVEPTFSNGAGTIDFGGGSPKGFKGSGGKVITITFQALRDTTARVQFTSGAALAADGQGTNVISVMREGVYTIRPRTEAPNPEYVAPSNTPAALAVTSSSHPDFTVWYNETTAILAWKLPADITELRTLLDEKTGSIPTIVYKTPFAEKTIEDLPEGVSYFHIQAKNKFGWGRVAHVRLGVDTQKPEQFKLTEAPREVGDPEVVLSIEAADKTSGIHRYEFVIDDREPIAHVEDGKKQFILPPLSPGRHTIVAKAFDGAGNYLVDSISLVVPALEAPRFTEYPPVVTVGTIIVAKGVSIPNARLTVTSTRQGIVVSTTTVLVLADGSFTYVAPEGTQAGTYTIVAEAVNAKGAPTAPSTPITIAARESGVVRIGSFVVSVLSVIIPLIALILVLLFIVLYVRHRVIVMRKRLSKEVGEAEKAIKEAFVDLHKEASKNIKLLEKVGSRRALTSEEEEVLTSLKGKLDTIEKKVEKEMADVERVLDGS